MRQRSRFDELFTVVFMISALGAIVCFFALDGQNPTYLILGGIALLIRITQYIIRMVK